MMIGIIDFILEKTVGISNISYDWHECISIALVIEITIIPFVINRKRIPILFGRATF